MCHSHLDHHLMIRDTETRLDGVTAPEIKDLKLVRPSLLLAVFEKISLLLKGFARV